MATLQNKTAGKQKLREFHQQTESLWYYVIKLQSAARMWAAQAVVRARRASAGPSGRRSPADRPPPSKAAAAAPEAAPEAPQGSPSKGLPGRGPSGPEWATPGNPTLAHLGLDRTGLGTAGSDTSSFLVTPFKPGESPTAAAYAQMQYLVAVLWQKSAAFDEEAFVSQIAAAQVPCLCPYPCPGPHRRRPPPESSASQLGGEAHSAVRRFTHAQGLSPVGTRTPNKLEPLETACSPTVAPESGAQTLNLVGSIVLRRGTSLLACCLQSHSLKLQPQPTDLTSVL